MESEPNMLSNRYRDVIGQIEASFRSGVLGEAMRSAPQFERRAKLSPEEFEREYRRKLKPVIIEGLMEDWPSLKTWNFDYLASKCGDACVVVDSYNSQRAREATFREFVGMLKEGGGADRQPIYLQEWLFMKDCPHLAEDMPELPIAQYDFRRNLYGEKISTNHQLWIGQKGATTRIHQDSYYMDVMHAQIVGEKHWCVMSPPAFLGRDESGEMNFEALAHNPDVQILQCVLKPGEVVYLPALWWHRIEILSDSIGLGRKCLDEVNLQKHTCMRFAELLSLALNHEHVKEAYPELYNVVVLRNRAWAKLLNIDLTKLRP
jgi:hypothetical protein